MMGVSIFYALLRILSKKDNPFRIKDDKDMEKSLNVGDWRIEETIPKSRCPSSTFYPQDNQQHSHDYIHHIPDGATEGYLNERLEQEDESTKGNRPSLLVLLNVLICHHSKYHH